MIHLINFLIKVLIHITFFNIIAICLILMSIIFWEGRYINFAGEIMDKLWKKKDN